MAIEVASSRSPPDLYRQLLDSSGDPIFCFAPDYRYLYANQAFADGIGRNLDEIVGRTLWDVFSKDEADKRASLVKWVFDHGEAKAHEILVQGRNAARYYLTTVTPIYDIQGQVSSVLANSKDITERKQAESVLKASEEKYRALVETTSTGYLILDREGKVIDANAEYVRLTGCSVLREIVGRSVLEWTADYEIERNSRAVAQCARDGFIRNLAIDYVDRMGRTTPIEINATVIGEGDCVQILSLCRDITERKLAQDVQRQNEAYTRTILDSVPDHIAVIDHEGVIRRVNEPWRRFALENSPQPGIPTAHTDVGTNYLEVCQVSVGSRAQGSHASREGILAVLEGKLPYFNMDYPCHFANQQQWFSMRVSPVRGNRYGAVIAHTNITDRVLANNALVESRCLIQEKEDRLAMAVLHNGTGIWDWNLQTLEMVWDDSMFALYHMRREDFSGAVDAWEKSLHPDDRVRAEREVQEALEGVKPFDTEFRVRWTNGEFHNIKAVAKVFRDETGNPVRMLGTNIDITERKKAEDALRKQQDIYHAVADHGQALIWMAGLDKGCYYFNAPWLAFTGRTLEQEQGNGWTEGVHPDDFQRCLEIYGTAFDRREAFSMEYRLRRQDGEYRWIIDDGTPRFDSGNFAGFVGHCLDITDRKRVEMELRGSEERLSFVVRGTNDGIWDWDLVRNEFYYSPRWWNMLGYIEGELADDADLWRRLLHPDDLERVNRIFGAELAGSVDTYDVEFRLLHKDGHYLPVLSRGFILRDETGKALRVCGANTDIAERKVAEDALRLTASVFAYAREGITVTDMLGNILDVNAAFSRITGYGREDALGQNPRFLQSGKQDKAFYIAMWRDLISQGYWEGEIWNRRKSGEVYPERLAIASVRDDQGNTQQYVAMFSDISDRKRIELELLESAQKFRLIAENTSDGITIFDKNRTIQYVSPSVMKQLGYSEQEELGRSNADVYALLHPDGRDELFQKLNHAIANKLQAMMYSYRIKHKTGHYIWREDSANFRYSIDGEYDGAYVVSRDITERKRLEDEVRQLAYFDPLTQLPNRRMLSDRLGQSIAGSNRSGLHAAVMVLDLDNFKPLNDQHGHLVGDLLLVEVARRLLACVREVDTVARFGGDEFVVVLNDLDEDPVESRRRVQAVAEKIRLALEVPYLLSFKNGSLPPITIEHHCSASIGVALFFNHEAAQSEILKWADAAMYQAKEAGRNSVRFYEKPENAYGVGKCQQSNSAPNYWNPS